MKASDLTEHSRERICSAEEVWLVDPNQRSGEDNKHPWMELIISVPPQVPDVVDPGASMSAPTILEIEVDSMNAARLERIRDQIRTMRGEPAITPVHPTGPV